MSAVRWSIRVYASDDVDTTLETLEFDEDGGEAAARFNELCDRFRVVGGGADLMRSDRKQYVSRFVCTLPEPKGGSTD